MTETRKPEDFLKYLPDSIGRKLEETRLFFAHSLMEARKKLSIMLPPIVRRDSDGKKNGAEIFDQMFSKLETKKAETINEMQTIFERICANIRAIFDLFVDFHQTAVPKLNTAFNNAVGEQCVGDDPQVKDQRAKAKAIAPMFHDQVLLNRIKQDVESRSKQPAEQIDRFYKKAAGSFAENVLGMDKPEDQDAFYNALQGQHYFAEMEEQVQAFVSKCRELVEDVREVRGDNQQDFTSIAANVFNVQVVEIEKFNKGFVVEVTNVNVRYINPP